MMRDGVEGRCVMMQVEDAGGKVHRHVAAERTENLEDLLDVGDFRYADEAQRLIGQQRGAKDGEDSVFIGGRRDLPA
jgi:hypothetical protein